MLERPRWRTHGHPSNMRYWLGYGTRTHYIGSSKETVIRTWTRFRKSENGAPHIHLSGLYVRLHYPNVFNVMPAAYEMTDHDHGDIE